MRVVPRRPSSSASTRAVVVLDTDASWKRLVVGGHLLESLDPATVDAATLSGIDTPRLLLNLAAPGALASLARLRDEGLTRPVWGVLADPEAPHALCLGMVDVTAPPITTDGVIAALLGRVPVGARLLTAGAEAERYLPLRRDLVRNGFSVSHAWTAEQALEVAGMTHPDLLVVDLELRGSHQMLAQRAAKAKPLSLLVVPSRAGDAAQFTAALRAVRAAMVLRPRAEVVSSILCAPQTFVHAPRVPDSTTPGTRHARTA